jgi:hypothetical protein
MRFYIYTLAHPETKEIFYVGQTAWWPNRAEQHKNNYLRTKGFAPIFELVEECNEELYRIDPIEQYWIYQFFAWGFPLINKRRETRVYRNKYSIKKAAQ